MMKKVISLVLALTFILALTGCTKKDMGRIMYNYNMKKFVELGEYEGIKIDTNGDEYKQTYDDMIASDIENYDLYVKVTEGTLKDGDVANIDFEGKLNGVAFDGGTAQGYDLELGSGSFIDGFEDKLIGVEIGETVDLDLNFPNPYPNNPDLAGKAVVFTVTVNYVLTDEVRTPEDYYADLGCESVEEYYENVKKGTISNIILTRIFTNSKVKKYPKKEKEMLIERQMSAIEQSASAQGVDAETLVQYYTNMSLDEYKEWLITNDIEPYLQSRMIIYAIFDDSNMKIDEKEFENFIKKEVASYKSDKITEKTLKEQNGDEFFEVQFIQEKVVDYLIENAKIS